VASSFDGVKLVAAVGGLPNAGKIYTSSDSGQSWLPRDTDRNWVGVASSADGAKLIAAAANDYIYLSTDSGATWIPQMVLSSGWSSVASSADGSVLMMSDVTLSSTRVYVSTNVFFFNPILRLTVANMTFKSMALSADGTKLIAATGGPAGGGQIYLSSDSGVSWTNFYVGSTFASWSSVASSADGSRLLAAESDAVNGTANYIYISGDSGVTWTQQEAPRFWNSVTCSNDGAKLVAAAKNGQIWTSSPVVSSDTTTTLGSAGYLVGGRGAALELLYTGNGQFFALGSSGTIFAY
jgi:hypothetical protein